MVKVVEVKRQKAFPFRPSHTEGQARFCRQLSGSLPLLCSLSLVTWRTFGISAGHNTKLALIENLYLMAWEEN